MKVEKLEHSQKKFTFDVTKEEFETALDKAFEKKNKTVAIKGFRKGAAPRSIYERTYGVESLFSDALDFVFGSKVEEIYKDAKNVQDIVGRFIPDVSENFKRGEDFQVFLTVDVYPEVNLPKYKGLEVAKKNLEVTDEEVENAVKDLAKKDAKLETKKEQVIEKGDFAVFDFVGSVDGVEFEGGSAKDYELQIGSGSFIPGFEDQMIGMKKDEEKDLNVTFPENYGAPNLAGKAAVFKVTVHEVKTQILPEFTDAYVKKLDKKAKTYEELLALKKEELTKRKETAENDRQVNELIDQIVKAAKVDMPASMIEERFNQIKSQYEAQSKMYGIPFERFIEMIGLTLEQFNDQAKKQAENQALFNVLASKIIEEEKLTPTDKQIEEMAAKEAKATGGNKEDLLNANRAKYFSDLAYKAFCDLLVKNAVEI